MKTIDLHKLYLILKKNEEVEVLHGACPKCFSEDVEEEEPYTTEGGDTEGGTFECNKCGFYINSYGDYDGEMPIAYKLDDMNDGELIEFIKSIKKDEND